MKRKEGAPLGNQNARKHGYYSRVLTPQEKRRLPAAQRRQGIDDEIALMRVKLRSLMQHDPDNSRLFLRAMNSLVRLYSLRRRS